MNRERLRKAFMIKKHKLELLYRRYNRREYVHPDPLQFLYRYPDLPDREIAGLTASALAYGRVAQILKSVESVLNMMGESPGSFLRRTPRSRMERIFSGFKHRFTSHRELVDLLAGMAGAALRHGNLNRCFLAGFRGSHATVHPALSRFVEEIRGGRDSGPCSLLPDPGRGSACKRLNLFLRWMVRRDAVDPGGWEGIPRSKLVIPLDTHMAKIGRSLGLTARRSEDVQTALEITRSFCGYAPEDPVKYDFALTRFGIRGELSMKQLVGDLAPG